MFAVTVASHAGLHVACGCLLEVPAVPGGMGHKGKSIAASKEVFDRGRRFEQPKYRLSG